MRSKSFGLAIIGSALSVVLCSWVCAATLDSWQSCCGAACLRVVSGILGQERDLAEIRLALRTDEHGRASLADMATTARSLGFRAYGLELKHSKLELCTAPLIAYEQPDHFVVLLGLGKGKGVLVIDPPRSPRVAASAELSVNERWRVLAVSRCPLTMNGEPMPEPSADAGAALGEPHDSESRTVAGLSFPETASRLPAARAGTALRHVFEFSNAGKGTVALTDIRSECPCLVVREWTRSVEGGQRGRIEVELDTTGLHGFVSKRLVCLVAGDANGGPQAVALRVEAMVLTVGSLVATPEVLRLGDLPQGTGAKRRVLLERPGVKEVGIKAIHSTSEAVEATLLPTDTRDALRRELEVVVRPRSDLGPFDHAVVVEMEDNLYPPTVLHVTGAVVPDIGIFPQVGAEPFFLGVLTVGQAFERLLCVRSRSGKPFDITVVRSTSPVLSASAYPTEASKTTWRVRLSSRADASPGIFSGRLLLQVDAGGPQQIEMAFVGLVKSQP